MSFRDELIVSAKPRTKQVEVPEWNRAVTIRELSAEYVLKEITESSDSKINAAKMIVASLVDESTGELVFADTPEDIAIVLGFGVQGVLRLGAAINAFNQPPADPIKN